MIFSSQRRSASDETANGPSSARPDSAAKHPSKTHRPLRSELSQSNGLRWQNSPPSRSSLADGSRPHQAALPSHDPACPLRGCHPIRSNKLPSTSRSAKMITSTESPPSTSSAKANRHRPSKTTFAVASAAGQLLRSKRLALLTSQFVSVKGQHMFAGAQESDRDLS